MFRLVGSRPAPIRLVARNVTNPVLRGGVAASNVGFNSLSMARALAGNQIWYVTPQSRRGFASSAVLSSADAPSGLSSVDMVGGYPSGSMTHHLLERCREAAVSRGQNLDVAYEPWLPVDLMQTALLNMHEWAQCSWTLAIVLTVMSLRVLTLPVSVAAIRGAREKALIQPQFQDLTEKQKQLTMEGNQEKAADVAKQLQAFSTKHGRFFMLKGTMNLFCVQMPLYITAFAAMRGFAGNPDVFPGFAMEVPGFLPWLDSLALADPYMILPCMTAAIMITNTELFGSIDTEVAAATPTDAKKDANKITGQSTFQKYQKHIMRGSALFFIPMTMNFPSAIFIFMSTNLLTASLQNRLLRLPTLERLFEIPPPLERIQAAQAAASQGGLPISHALLAPEIHAPHAGEFGQGYLRPQRFHLWQPEALPVQDPALLAAAKQLLAASSGRKATDAVGLDPRERRPSQQHSVFVPKVLRTVADLDVSSQYAVRRRQPSSS